MAFVQFSKVSLAFGDRDILKDVSINLQSGSKVALTGTNGAGKSTLLKMLSGNLVPSIIENCDGKILIDNIDLYNANSNNSTFLKEKIGFVYEQPFFYEEETVCSAGCRHDPVSAGRLRQANPPRRRACSPSA